MKTTFEDSVATSAKSFRYCAHRELVEAVDATDLQQRLPVIVRTPYKISSIADAFVSSFASYGLAKGSNSLPRQQVSDECLAERVGSARALQQHARIGGTVGDYGAQTLDEDQEQPRTSNPRSRCGQILDAWLTKEKGASLT